MRPLPLSCACFRLSGCCTVLAAEFSLFCFVKLTFRKMIFDICKSWSVSESCFIPYPYCWLSHAAVTWLPWFSPIVPLRIAHCDIKPTGYAPHKCVTLTVAWTAEWCLACPGCGILYCSASEHVTRSTLFGSSQEPVVVFNMVPASWAGNDDPQHAEYNYGHWQIQQRIWKEWAWGSLF